MTRTKRRRHNSASSSDDDDDSAVYSDGGWKHAPYMPHQRERELTAQLTELQAKFDSHVQAAERKHEALQKQHGEDKARTTTLVRKANEQVLQLRATRAQRRDDKNSFTRLIHELDCELHRCKQQLSTNTAAAEKRLQQIQELHKQEEDVKDRELATLKLRLAKLDAEAMDRIQKEQAYKAHISGLEDTIALLRSQLEAATDQVIALQGGLQNDLLPTVIQQRFQDLVEAVGSWVDERIWALEDNPEHRQALLTHAATLPFDLRLLRAAFKADFDVQATCLIQGTDADCFTSLIWNFLYKVIFMEKESSFLGIKEQGQRLQVIRDIEGQMFKDCESSEDMYSVSVWSARAINTLNKSPAVEAGFRTVSKNLTECFGKMLFAAFCVDRSKESREQFANSIQKTIVDPALDLSRLMVCERNSYFLDFQHYNDFEVPISPAEVIRARTARSLPPRGCRSRGFGPATKDAPTNQFFRNLDNHDCNLVAPGRRQVKFERKKYLANVPMKVIQARMEVICAVTPALVTQLITDKDGLGQPVTLVKQKSLVTLDNHATPGRVQREGNTYLCDFAVSSKLEIG